jgi:hypothetical protein
MTFGVEIVPSFVKEGQLLQCKAAKYAVKVDEE